jgi:hypothetical protein
MLNRKEIMMLPSLVRRTIEDHFIGLAENIVEKMKKPMDLHWCDHDLGNGVATFNFGNNISTDLLKSLVFSEHISGRDWGLNRCSDLCRVSIPWTDIPLLLDLVESLTKPNKKPPKSKQRKIALSPKG